MTIDTTSLRTRRAILASAAGAVAATVATAVRPIPAAALNGDPIKLGNAAAAPFTGFGTNQAISGTEMWTSSQTGLKATTAGIGERGLIGSAAATSGSGVGVEGTSSGDAGIGILGSGQAVGVAGSTLTATGVGVHGYNWTQLLGVPPEETRIGVLGESGGPGVVGRSGAWEGVFGRTDSATAAATAGQSVSNGCGVLGFSGAGQRPVAPAKTGVYGYAVQDANARGVVGQSTSGQGVRGVATTGMGVVGVSTSSHGVHATSTSASAVYGASSGAYGVYGTSASTVYASSMGTSTGNATGVYGYSGTAAAPPAPAKTGVYGYAAQDATSSGVKGQGTSGTGVSGVATTGTGVRGAATTGTAGYFATSTATAGYAIRALGRVKLDNCAGVATVAAGTNAVTVVPGIDLVATSAVVATLQGDAGGATTVKRVAVDATANTFTIVLTGNAAASVKVAWHVFG